MRTVDHEPDARKQREREELAQRVAQLERRVEVIETRIAPILTDERRPS